MKNTLKETNGKNHYNLRELIADLKLLETYSTNDAKVLDKYDDMS
jgi:hypothetical protein